MRYKKVVMSTVMLSLLATGCVKPTDEPNKTGATVYNDQPTGTVYTDSTPVIYDESTTTSGTLYGEDGTVISTENYEPATVATTTATTGPFDDPYAGDASGEGSEVYVAPDSGGGASTVATVKPPTTPSVTKGELAPPLPPKI